MKRLPLLLLLLPALASAQSATTGAVEGRVVDETGHGRADITVWATSEGRDDPQVAVTDEDGHYKITDLPPGDYTITFYDPISTIAHPNVHVSPNDVTPVYERIDVPMVARPKDEHTVYVYDRPPQINLVDATKDYRYDRDFLEKIPLPNNTYIGAAGTVPGAANDGVGIAFSGSTSLENRYLVDGIDVTGLTYGTVGTPLLSEFIDEVEVITGGYNAEWGRATGGIVNAVTKHGTNKFSGSIFGTLTPGFLSAGVKSAPVNASSIDTIANRAYSADFGAEVGGPIIKNKLWFYAGFAPELARTDYTRIVKRQTDCKTRLPDGSLSTCDPRLVTQGGFADGKPDIDPDTGFYLTDEVDREVRSATSQSYTALAKLNLALTPQQQAQASIIAVPSHSRSPVLYGLDAGATKADGLTLDGAARWSGKFFDGKTEVEGVLAWHHSSLDGGAVSSALDAQPGQVLTGGSLGTWSQLGGESQRVIDLCTDDTPNDSYKSITNCPMISRSYSVGGPGTLTHDREDRKIARASVLHRAKLLGSHELEAGIDLEDDTKETARLLSGGAFIQNDVRGRVFVTRWVALAAADDTDPRFDRTCHGSDTPAGVASGVKCAYLSGERGAPGTAVGGESVDAAAYLRDSWQIRPNLTLNVGLRYEEQRLLYAEQLRNTTDPLTGEHVGTTAMSLTGNWAPRLGLIWDPTEEGRAKVYGSWGRFFEAIPMDINDREFGGEVSYVQRFDTLPNGGARPCGPSDPMLGGPNGLGCLMPSGAPSDEQMPGASGVLVAPGVKAEYLDELLIGAELQIAPDLKVGVSYQNRRLGRVIEDVSPDGSQTYIIANPGEWSASEQRALEQKIATAPDAATAARLTRDLALYKSIRTYDKPRRDYNALELTISKRVSDGLFLQASYTYSRTQGNYPGSLSYDNGQIDPNISSQYDLIELLANRDGALPQDRPHSLKVDGYYTFDLGKQQALTIGGRVRVVSGVPINALGAHYLYGQDESELLPRGSLGRTELEHGVDVHVSYARELPHGMRGELYVDAFNLYNRQGVFSVDETYAPVTRGATAFTAAGANNVNPISGGAYEDLIWAKTIDASGNETQVPTARNPNYGHATSRYAPFSAQIGFRLIF